MTLSADQSKKEPTALGIVEPGDGCMPHSPLSIYLVFNRLELTAEVHHKDELLS
jgi:hypothetical protein